MTYRGVAEIVLRDLHLISHYAERDNFDRILNVNNYVSRTEVSR